MIHEFRPETPEEAVEHYGKKGMHWGVKTTPTSGVSSKTDKAAKKDAEEFTRAKLFYGEGAGTRRKLIKATVEAKSKADPAYKKAFEQHVESTDLGKRASQAQGQRKRKDAVNSTKKTARGIKNVLNGNAQYASVASVLLVSGAMAIHKKGIDRVVLKSAQTRIAEIKKSRASAKFVADLLKNAQR